VVQTERLSFNTKGNCDIIDITEAVSKKLSSARMKSGIVTMFVVGSTGGLTTVEYEPGLVKDINELFEKIIPSNKSYHHDETWHDGNGHSHLRASLLGPSLTVPFESGRLLLGTWQQIIFIDFDIRRRNREIILQFIGE